MSKEARALGFPVEHKHKLASLRQELIDSFVEARYVQFIKHAAVHLQQLTSVKRSQKEKEVCAKVMMIAIVIAIVIMTMTILMIMTIVKNNNEAQIELILINNNNNNTQLKIINRK